MGSFVTFVNQLMKIILYAVFVTLSRLLRYRTRIHDFLFRAWQGELKYGTSRLIYARPQPAPVGIDDRPADGQPHPCSAGLCGVKRLENALEIFGIDPRS